MNKKFFVHQNHRIAYFDIGQGPSILFVHGTPVSSDEFELLIQILKDKYRCIAIDHLGFGHSDKPPFGNYTLNAHRERLNSLVRFLDLDNFHIVVTDFGGPIVFPWAIINWNRIRSLTLMNTWAWPLSAIDPKMKRMSWFLKSSFMKYLYINWNFSARFLIKSAWGSYKPITNNRHRFYQNFFQKKNDRFGVLAFLDALFDETEISWKASEQMKPLEKKPVFIFWGMADPMISQQNLKKWHETFPHAKIESFAHVGHFVAEEAAELVGPRLLTYLTEVDQSK